jgi:hypothetical protein
MIRHWLTMIASIGMYDYTEDMVEDKKHRPCPGFHQGICN